MTDYYEEEGKVVFTKEFLLKRGYCCGNGCRNCPYRGDSKIVQGSGLEEEGQ